jgi:hypothetical protein
MSSQIADDLKLGNIPLINLMQEFFLWNKHIRSPKFKEQCAVGHVGLVHTPLMIWGGDVSDLLTLILQRTILGCESYVCGAVWIELGNAGRLTTELNKQVRSPFTIKLKQGGTAYRYYNAVPALLDPKLALEKKNSALWAIVEEFYSEIRNKIQNPARLSNRLTQSRSVIQALRHVLQNVPVDWRVASA